MNVLKEKQKTSHKNNIPCNKGKTYEESYGFEKAQELKELRKGKHWEEIYGIEKAKHARIKLSESNSGKKRSDEDRKKMSLDRKGIPWNERYGIETANRMREHNRNIQTGRIISQAAREAISKANSGTYESRFGKEKADKIKAKISEAFKGDKHPLWLGGKSFEPYGLDFNKELKKKIKERDGCCMLCNLSLNNLKLLKRNTATHHVDYVKTNNLSQNLITLCIECHLPTNYNRNQWTTFFQSILKERYGYEYTQDQKIVLDFTNT